MPNYQTNPVQIHIIFGALIFSAGTYNFCRGICKWVRSRKTNPFEGGFRRQIGRSRSRIGSIFAQTKPLGVARVMVAPYSRAEELGLWIRLREAASADALFAMADELKPKLPTPHPNPLPPGEKGCNIGARQRSFDKSRKLAGSRRMAGLRMTGGGRHRALRRGYSSWCEVRV